jgi:hypothetical protein
MPLVKIDSGGDDQSKADVEMRNVRLLLSDILLSPRQTLTRRPLFPYTKCLLQVTYPLLENMSISKVSLVPVVHPHTSQNGYIQDPIPRTFTASYDEQTVPRDYAESVCTMFAQLGVHGSNILFSTGGFGLGAASFKTNDGTNKTMFRLNFLLPVSVSFLF